jgi:nucleoside phosphorylase
MRRRARQRIHQQEAAYLELLLRTPDPESKKNGMQRLCKLYRLGYRLQNPHSILILLVGLLYSEYDKVRRWALNSLALLGTIRETEAILDAIRRSRDNPDVLGAGISALTAIVRDEQAKLYLKKADLPLDQVTLLAASQQSGAFASELRKTRVKIDIASDPELRLASVLIGIDRAPENLFSLKHDNRKIIGQLNTHPDRIVAQYSVWAIHENPRMSLQDLRVDLADVEWLPANVRKYIYQLVTADSETARRNHDMLVLGSVDSSTEAREGLAKGIGQIFFDSLEQLILDWFADEDNDAVKQRLLEHMAAYAKVCPAYEKPVLEMYRSAASNSLIRSRLESAARNTDMFLEMKRISLDAESTDLFGKQQDIRRSRTISKPSTSSANLRAMQLAQKTKTLLVTALPKETAAVRATFDHFERVETPSDPSIYELGTYGDPVSGRRVILAESSVGKVNATALTTHALRTFPNIEHIIMVGIAGGCPNPAKAEEHVRLGDVVRVSHLGVIEYDNVKRTELGVQIRGSAQKPSAKLLRIANLLAGEELQKKWPWEEIATISSRKLDGYDRPKAKTDKIHVGSQVVKHPVDSLRRDNQPRVHAGAIATADTLQKDPKVRDSLRDTYGVRAIEMEGSALQSAAWHQGKDAFVVRGICDYSDGFKNDTWQNYAALVAASYVRSLIEAMPDNWF